MWTDLYIYVEHLIEGDRSARIRLAATPWWKPGKIVKRVSKHIVWLLIAVATGGAWVFYFTDAPTLAYNLVQGSAPFLVYAAIGVLTFTTYSLGGFLREQVCTFMCPWPRIQGAMTDSEALVVTYRRDRGELRGPHKKGQSWTGRGACIDCNQCVAACPMGIDIRDGAQLECINCGLCIDACDDVMVRVGLPKGLIAYDTDANIVRRLKGEKPRYRFVRWRTFFYVVVIAVVATIMVVGLRTRRTIDLDVLPDRNPAFVQLSDGAMRNAYTLKVMNRADVPREFYLSVSELPVRSVNVIGLGKVKLPVKLSVESDTVRTLRVLVTVGPHDLRPGSEPILFSVSNMAHTETRNKEDVFISGEP